MTEMVLSAEARLTAGVLLLSIVAVESGGLYMLRIVRRQMPATGFQISFSRNLIGARRGSVGDRRADRSLETGG